MRHLTATICLTVAVLLGSAGSSVSQTNNPDEIVSFYKDSVVVKNTRILIATFNSEEKAWRGSRFDYNWENCLTAARLFLSQPDAKTKFWCEKGPYRE